jgi:putative glycosyl hydrolase-like family 15 (GHL15) protein
MRSDAAVGVLRIIGSEPIPSDLRGVRYLLLDAGRGDQVGKLKGRYPRLEVLAYKNLSFLIDYSDEPRGNAGVPWPEAQPHEAWFLHDTGGSRVTSVNFEQAWFADVGLPAYQRAWQSDVLAFLKAAPWDGVFIDDALADPGWHLDGDYARLAHYPSRSAYQAAERSMLAAVGPAITNAGYLAVANIAAARDQPDVWADWAPLLSGAMREHFLKQGDSTEPVFTGREWALDTEIERVVEGSGRIFLGLTYGPNDDTAAQGYARASFLLFDTPSTRSASIWSPDPTASSTFDLGRPLGPATRKGATWTRRFQRGTITVDSAAGTYEAG